MWLNGERIMQVYFNHSALVNGGELKFSMAAEPQLNYNFQEKDLPPKKASNLTYTRTPIIHSKGVSFKENQLVEITSEKGNSIFFRKNASGKKGTWEKYQKTIEINDSQQIESFTVSEKGDSSYVVEANFVKRPNNYTIQIKGKYNPQYTAGGDEGILDGIRGSTDWRKGYWQGFQGQDFEAIVDMGTLKKLTEIKAGFLQDQRSWILMPKYVEFWTSIDGKNFTLAKTVKNEVDEKQSENTIVDFGGEISPGEYRYIKVVARNYGKLPDWHQGFGGEAFIFIDEIMLR
jgi:hypothetical protein